MLDLFVFRCQKCSIGKLIFYAGGEYKILHRQFFDGDTLQDLFFNKKVVLFIKSRRIRNSRTKDFPFEKPGKHDIYYLHSFKMSS